MKGAKAHIRWEFAPFYRRWQGWGWLLAKPWYRGLWIGVRLTLWWAWPIRWVMVVEAEGYLAEDYYCTANEAAIALARKAPR